MTDLLPGLRKLRSLLPEHGCLLLSPGNFWQNDWERFHADPDIIGTIHQHEPKTLQTSATLKGTLSIQDRVWPLSPSVDALVQGCLLSLRIRVAKGFWAAQLPPCIVAVTVTALSVSACFCPQTCCSVFLGSTVGSASTRGRGWSHTPSPWSSSATMPSKALRLPSSVGDLALSICFSDQHGPRLPIKMSVLYTKELHLII